MSYKLPPSRDDNGVVGAVLTLLGVIVFLASPFGSIFFAVVNSLVVLSVLLPLGAIVAFQTWQFFYTTQGPCPNCNASIRVLKDGSPSICFNCGSVVMCSNEGGTNVELISETTTTPSVVFQDSLVEDDYSVFGETTWGSSSSSNEKENPYKRKQTIIDVVIEEEEDKK